MKYFIFLFGLFAIFIVTVCNFYPSEVMDYVRKITGNDNYVIAVSNEYYLDYGFKYVDNYTDDVNNKKELLDYIYYVINTGSEYADGECVKEYKDCISDLESIATDEQKLSMFNNFVHPYNSFKTISFTYDDSGKFSMAIEHIYKKDEIKELNNKIDDILKDIITPSMNTSDKIKAIHNYVIDHTQYDEKKVNNIHDETYRSNTAYGVIIEGYGICSGYSDTISIMLNKLSIENYKVSNATHIWNLVYVNGKWVHLDATWDDPISTNNISRDTYFLIDYDSLVKLDDGTHTFDKNIFQEAV